MIDENEIALRIAERVVDFGTEQGRIPFLTGDLRKSIQDFKPRLLGNGRVMIGSNLSYARAVHDGRPAIVIKPKNKKFLAWRAKSSRGYISKKTGKEVKTKSGNNLFIFAKEVKQKARTGKPFLRQAVEQLEREGFSFLEKDLQREVGSYLAKTYTSNINIKIEI